MYFKRLLLVFNNTISSIKNKNVTDNYTKKIYSTNSELSIVIIWKIKAIFS